MMQTSIKSMSKPKPQLTLIKFDQANLLEGRHILIVETSESKRAVVLNASVFVIGRHPQSSLVLTDNMVSRCHATIAWLQYEKSPQQIHRSYWIIDGKGKQRRSRNGILVNGNKTSLHRLTSGDLVEIGQTIKITYNYIPYNTETHEFLEYCEVEKPQQKTKNKNLSYKDTIILNSDEI
ncbi:diguanylate cyclase/phosphodiesterase with PAS/PAC sensor [Stanieria sp. NIES-3757]|nr:diguanylate cyclase/phosphodiesterase with PAS/PAC sensor [Stanieria sp. NIES-3757]